MRHDINKLRPLYTGKDFYNLTVMDVVRDESNEVCFLCKCSCGKDSIKPMRSVLSGHVKSCGCRSNVSKRVNLKDLTNKYKNTKVNWLTIQRFQRDANNTNIIYAICICRCGNEFIIEKKRLLGKSPPISCGCYRQSDEYKQSHKMSRETKNKISARQKAFYEKHPERREEISKRSQQFYIDNPERRNQIGMRVSRWFKTDNDGVRRWADRRRSFYKNHPEVGDRIKTLYRENPEILKKIPAGNKKFNAQHPEFVRQRNFLTRLRAYLKRASTDYTELLKITHPDDIERLVSGSIRVNDIIRTKCPCCNKYAQYSLNTVFIIGTCRLRNNKPALCRECHVSLTSCYTSKYEQEIADYISTFYTGNIIRNDRKVLKGKELDLYYPDAKVAVEFNGDYWHSDLYKDPDYHYNK